MLNLHSDKLIEKPNKQLIFNTILYIDKMIFAT